LKSSEVPIILVLGFAISTFSPATFAHHGFANYDTEKKLTVNGTVTRWVWSNPHCLLLLDAADNTGQVAHWVLETENPSSMIRSGWTKDSIKVGDQITVMVMPVKTGGSVGRIMEVVLPNGQKLMGRGGPQPAESKPEESPRP
jgi:uncharacterized protein DUF6152